jgi:hypothetical protein
MQLFVAGYCHRRGSGPGYDTTRMRPEEYDIPVLGVRHISTTDVTAEHCQTVRVCLLGWEPGWPLVVEKR